MNSILASCLIATTTAGGVGELVDRVVHSITDPIGAFIDSLPIIGDKDDKPDAEAPKQQPKPQVIGTVRFAYEGFVLIYTPTGRATPAGTIATTLDTEGNPTNVQLRIGAERKNSFLVADVLEGSPRSGQFVIIKPKLQPGATDYQILE
ncbi:MAG: hypothetical protein ACI8UO_004501 [Verrucomicrobiales bacterium]|jgi:hypothetical protein